MVRVLPVHFLGCPNRRLIKFICICFIFIKRKQKKQIQQHDVTSTDRFEWGFCLPMINQKTLQIHDKCIIQSMQQLTQSQPWDRATRGSTTRALIATLPDSPSRSSRLSLSVSVFSLVCRFNETVSSVELLPMLTTVVCSALIRCEL